MVLDDPKTILVQGTDCAITASGKNMVTSIEMPQKPPKKTKIVRYAKILLVIGALFLLKYGGNQVMEQINFQIWPEHEQLIIALLWFSIAAYVLLMAIPYLPGMEIGLALMAMFGAKGVAIVYLCTLLSLSLSFAVGRLIPLKIVYRFLGWLHLYKARDLAVQMEPLNPQERMDHLLLATPSKVIPLLLKHRYLMIAAILNLPGNALIGGGGGIGLIAGMSGLYPYPKFLVLISLAITPLPILFLTGHFSA